MFAHERSSAIIARGGQLRPQRTVQPDGMRASATIIGGDDEAMLGGCIGNCSPRTGWYERLVAQGDQHGVGARMETIHRCQRFHQRRGLATGPLRVGHRGDTGGQGAQLDGAGDHHHRAHPAVDRVLHGMVRDGQSVQWGQQLVRGAREARTTAGSEHDEHDVHGARIRPRRPPM